MTHRFSLLITVALCAALTAACQTTQTNNPTPDKSGTVGVRSTWTPVPVVAMIDSPIPTVAPPTVTPLPATLTPAASPTLVPSPTLPPPTAVLTNTRRPTMTLSPTTANLTINTAIPGPFGGDTATWTPPAPGPRLKDHYVFYRPVGEDHVNYWARNYSYGSTDGGTRPVHHGVDIPNETGTPVLAGGDGIVFYADDDKTTTFGPQPDFYGNVIVLQHTLVDADGQIIYTLYGHLSKIEVSKAQKVRAGQEIGLVGSTGVALGAHIHFEVRSGNPYDYNATRNPELWIMSYQGYGVLAGRITDLNGHPLGGVQVEIQSPETYRFGYSYADNSVNGDLVFGENFAIPDLPSGYYYVFVKSQDGALRFKTLTYIRPGRTNWIEIHVSDLSG
jgi:murein DD-endopeptidase MepM/ murein hydrolase activator NlpD